MVIIWCNDNRHTMAMCIHFEATAIEEWFEGGGKIAQFMLTLRAFMTRSKNQS